MTFASDCLAATGSNSTQLIAIAIFLTLIGIGLYLMPKSWRKGSSVLAIGAVLIGSFTIGVPQPAKAAGSNCGSTPAASGPVTVHLIGEGNGFTSSWNNLGELLGNTNDRIAFRTDIESDFGGTGFAPGDAPGSTSTLALNTSPTHLFFWFGSMGQREFGTIFFYSQPITVAEFNAGRTTAPGFIESIVYPGTLPYTVSTTHTFAPGSDVYVVYQPPLG
jgi:hypothetical protein